MTNLFDFIELVSDGDEIKLFELCKNNENILKRLITRIFDAQQEFEHLKKFFK